MPWLGNVLAGYKPVKGFDQNNNQPILNKPSIIQQLLTRGNAGMQYNDVLGNVALQQMRQAQAEKLNQQDIDARFLMSENNIIAQQQAAEKAQQNARDLAILNQIGSVLGRFNIPQNDANTAAYNSAIAPQARELGLTAGQAALARNRADTDIANRQGWEAGSETSKAAQEAGWLSQAAQGLLGQNVANQQLNFNQANPDFYTAGMLGQRRLLEDQRQAAEAERLLRLSQAYKNFLPEQQPNKIVPLGGDGAFIDTSTGAINIPVRGEDLKPSGYKQIFPEGTPRIVPKNATNSGLKPGLNIQPQLNNMTNRPLMDIIQALKSTPYSR